MSSETIIVLGIDAVAKTALALGEKHVRRSAAALYVEGEMIMSASKPLVPVDTGALRSSGFVNPPAVSLGGFGKDVEVVLGYGGAAAGYAAIVHNDLSAKHTVGQALYLEEPSLAAIPGMPQRIADAAGGD